MTLCAAPLSVEGTGLSILPHARGRSRWIELLPHLAPHHGGLSSVVPQLGEQLARREDYEIQIASFDTSPEASQTTTAMDMHVTHWPSRRLSWVGDRKLRSSFHDLLAHADGMHIHGLWSSHAAVSAQAARALRKPYIVSAHGMLEPWALAQKAWKKRVYTAFVERKTLDGASCLHALTHAEAEDYRRYGCKAPIAVIPNAVDVPEEIDRSLFMRTFPQVRGQKIILFLGRLHFKKGVDALVQAWGALADRFPGATLVLAGPDTNGTQGAHERCLASSGLSDRVVFTGMLDAPMKWSALASSSCFVLPSYSEGFSVAVLEALAVGLPAIVSTRCHFPEIEQSGAGWVIEPTQKQIHDAIEDLLTRSDEANFLMGLQGKELVRSRFSWPIVAEQMAELYSWVQGGPHPQTFELIEGD